MSTVHEGIVQVIDHPSAQVFLTECRDMTTDTEKFGDRLGRLGHILACEVLKRLAIRPRNVLTPLKREARGATFDGRVALVPVLRAGDALQDGFRTFMPGPLVWHLGLRRNEDTLEPEVYTNKVPDEPPSDLQLVVVLEIMLATGGSACAAIDILKNRNIPGEKIVFVCVLAAPEGIQRVQTEHPDVDIFTVAIDQRLTGEGEEYPPGFIVPGLGDAGDRRFPSV